MERRLKIFVILASLAGALWGCGSNSTNPSGNGCNSAGCYNPYGGYGSPYATNINPSAVILQGNLNPVNNAAWGTFLRGNQACMTAINSCWGLDGPAGVTLVVNDANFSGPRGASTGNLNIQTEMMQLPYNVNFLKTANGYAAGLQTAPYVQLNYHNTNTGGTYFLQVTGLVSDSTQNVVLMNNGAVIAQGTLARIQ